MIIPREQLYIIGVVRYTDDIPSFALPILSNSLGERLYIQVRHHMTQAVIGFEELSDLSRADLDHETHAPVSAGDSYVHGFIDRKGQLYLDVAANLKAPLSVALNDERTPTVTRLTISELIGDFITQSQIRRNLAREFGGMASDAARAYESSAVRSRLWSILEGAAVDEAAAVKVRNHRSRLIAEVDKNLEIRIDLSVINISALVTISEDEIERRLRSEFSELGTRRDKLPKVDLSQVRQLHDPTPLKIIEAVKLSPRAEERIAILLRAILVHPHAGFGALTLYDEASQFGSQAVGAMRGRVSESDLEDSDILEMRVAQLVSRLFTDSYPMRRGELLYYLALHLSEFPNVNGAIRAALSRSLAQNVDFLRADIEAILDHRGDRLRK